MRQETAMHQQIQERRRLQASKHKYKQCRIQITSKIRFVDVVWGRKCTNSGGFTQCILVRQNGNISLQGTSDINTYMSAKCASISSTPCVAFIQRCQFHWKSGNELRLPFETETPTQSSGQQEHRILLLAFKLHSVLSFYCPASVTDPWAVIALHCSVFVIDPCVET